MPEYIYRGEHAVDIVKADGSSVMIGNGDTIELTAKEMEVNEHYKDALLPTSGKGGDDK